MDPTDKDFELGSIKEHFKIDNNTITGLSEQILTALRQHTYTGKFVIRFPGCENIRDIQPNAFNDECLYNVCLIDLSIMNELRQIGSTAFANVGRKNRNFSLINLSCPRLEIIGQEAFENVGHLSNYVEIIFGESQLTLIEDGCFRSVGMGKKSSGVQLEKVQLDLKQTKISGIGYYAFQNYNKYTKAKLGEILFPNTEFHYLKKGVFKNMFSNCDKVIFNLNTKSTRLIDKECFAGMKIHLSIGDKVGISTIELKAIDVEYLNNGLAKLSISRNNEPIYKILGYPPLLFFCLSENGQLENLSRNYDDDNIIMESKYYSIDGLNDEIFQIKQDIQQTSQTIKTEFNQYIQQSKYIQLLTQRIEAQKQILQLQQQFILEQEHRLKALMISSGYLDDKDLAKKFQ